MVEKNEVLAALRGILSPDGRTPLSESPALSGVSIRDGKVFAAVLVDPAQARAYEPTRSRAEAAIKAVPGVTGAIVTLTAESAERPTTAHTHSHSHPPPRRAGAASTALPGVRHVVAVASGKGGVGKSTTACNLAVAMARSGRKVGLLDADVFGPSVPRLFGIKDRPGLAPDGKRLFPLENYGVKVMSIGFLVEEETPMIWRGPMVVSALNQLLREVVWGELDVLFVDMPPGTGDVQLTMAQNVPLSGAVIVSTPQDLALIDARRGVSMFRKTEVPILGIIENMSYFVCPHCGGRSDIFAHGGARHEAERLGVPFLGEIPLELAIRQYSDAGRPIVAAVPDGSHAKSYVSAAEQIWAALAGEPARKSPTIRFT